MRSQEHAWKYFLPQNIYSLPIKRETNKHTRLAVAILKSSKDFERVPLGIIVRAARKEEPADLLQVLRGEESPLSDGAIRCLV